jgi:hypothetical protein
VSKHKKQHYIPKCYLNAWCDSNCPPKQTPYVWLFEMMSRQGKNKSPENIFHETDMYTIKDKAGGRSLVIEHGLSWLKKQFTKIRKNKLKRRRVLDRDDHFLVCVFVAAMHARTKSQIKYISDQWRGILEDMDELDERMKRLTEEERCKMAQFSGIGGSEGNKGLTHEQVRAIVKEPVRMMVLPMIEVESSLIASIDFCILYTDAIMGFITSDRPCVWFDPEDYKRPPMYRGWTEPLRLHRSGSCN